MSELPADHVICPNCVHHFHAVSQESKDYIAALKATIQAVIGVIDNWKVPLLDPDGKDCSEAVMRLLADDLRKALKDKTKKHTDTDTKRTQ